MFDFHAFNRARIAHGVCMSLAVILFFPLGGIILRLLKIRGNVNIHIAWQILGLCMLTAGFGLGVWVQDDVFIVSSPASDCTVLPPSRSEGDDTYYSFMMHLESPHV